MIWGTLIAWYLFLAGLSAGAFITSVYVENKYPHKTKLLFVTRVLALVAIAIGLVILILDATGAWHNPLSLIHLLGALDSSVMSWGVIFLAVLAIVEFLFVIYEFLRGKDNGYTRAFDKAKGVLSVIGVIFAIATAAYTGLLIGVIKTMPLWNNALLPILFFVSAMSSGVAGALVFTGIFDRREIEGMHSVTVIHVALLIIEVLLVAAMFFILSSGNPAGAESVQMMVTGQYALLFWVVFMLLGLLVPIAVELWELKTGKGSPMLTIAIELLVLIGGFVLRYLIVHAAVPVNFLGF